MSLITDVNSSDENIRVNFGIIMYTFSGKENEIIDIPLQFRPKYKLKFEDDEFIYYIKCLITMNHKKDFVFCGVIIDKEDLNFSEMTYIDYYQIIDAKHKQMNDIEKNLELWDLVKYYKKILEF